MAMFLVLWQRCSIDVAQADLHLARIAQARLHGAVEIEQEADARRIAEIVRVEQVEDLDNGL